MKSCWRELAKTITGSTIVKYGEHELDFGKFERLSMREAIVEVLAGRSGERADARGTRRSRAGRAAAERYNAWAKSTRRALRGG